MNIVQCSITLSKFYSPRTAHPGRGMRPYTAFEKCREESKDLLFISGSAQNGVNYSTYTKYSGGLVVTRLTTRAPPLGCGYAKSIISESSLGYAAMLQVVGDKAVLSNEDAAAASTGRVPLRCRYTEDIINDLEVKVAMRTKSCQNTMAKLEEILVKTNGGVREEAAHQRRKGTNRRVSGP